MAPAVAETLKVGVGAGSGAEPPPPPPPQEIKIGITRVSIITLRCELLVALKKLRQNKLVMICVLPSKYV